MPIVSTSPGVFTCDDSIVHVNAADIATITAAIPGTPKRRARICAHRSADEPIHEMLIVMPRDTYIRPHKHEGRIESFHVVAGEADVLFFSEAGALRQVVRLGTYVSGFPFYQRVAEPIFHSVVVRSETLVVHETTGGPFRPSETLFAEWAPDESDAGAGRVFLERAISDHASALRELRP